jgi:hypothetical protein
MPSLVRAGFTALAPVAVSTVSDRARRERASAISSAHSSAESSSAKTTTRGSVIAMTTRTSRSPARIAGVPALMAAPGTGRAGSVAACGDGSRRGGTAEVGAHRRLEGRDRDLPRPAARLHRVEDDVGRVAGGRLRDDPSSQLGGDGLHGHAPILPDRAAVRRDAGRRSSGNRGCG